MQDAGVQRRNGWQYTPEDRHACKVSSDTSPGGFPRQLPSPVIDLGIGAPFTRSDGL
jgi:hypothetical protein